MTLSRVYLSEAAHGLDTGEASIVFITMQVTDQAEREFSALKDRFPGLSRWSSVSPSNHARYMDFIRGALAVEGVTLHFSRPSRMKLPRSGFLGQDHIRYARLLEVSLDELLQGVPRAALVMDSSPSKRGVRLNRALFWYERQQGKACAVKVVRPTESMIRIGQFLGFLTNAYAYAFHNNTQSIGKLRLLHEILCLFQDETKCRLGNNLAASELMELQRLVELRLEHHTASLEASKLVAAT